MDYNGRQPPDDDPEEILSSSLEILYGYQAITQSSAGSLFSYTPKSSIRTQLPIIVLQTPDTAPANWSLHASSIWIASIFLADHIDDLHPYLTAKPDIRVLELGAGTGLPSILISKIHPDVWMVISDYPDEELIGTLRDNIGRNGVASRCRAMPYAWGSDISTLLSPDPALLISNQVDLKFDIVLAADTLWNSESHKSFIETLRNTLKRTADARVFLIAGFHTGRYAIHAFLKRVEDAGFDLESCIEREAKNGQNWRTWDPSRADGEDEAERRRWVIWVVLKWRESEL